MEYIYFTKFSNKKYLATSSFIRKNLKRISEMIFFSKEKVLIHELSRCMYHRNNYILYRVRIRAVLHSNTNYIQ